MPLLGLYDRCYTLSHYGVLQLPRFLSSTALPSLAIASEDPQRFRRLVRGYLRWLGVLFLIGTVGMYLLAEPIVSEGKRVSAPTCSAAR